MISEFMLNRPVPLVVEMKPSQAAQTPPSEGKPEQAKAPAKAVGRKKPTNVSLPTDLIDRARELGVNVSQASEQGVRQAIQEIEARQWAEQNAELVKSYNSMVEREGLPLAKYRTF